MSPIRLGLNGLRRLADELTRTTPDHFPSDFDSFQGTWVGRPVDEIAGGLRQYGTVHHIRFSEATIYRLAENIAAGVHVRLRG